VTIQVASGELEQTVLTLGRDQPSSTVRTPSLLFADASRIVHLALINGAPGVVITADGKPVSIAGLTLDFFGRMVRGTAWARLRQPVASRRPVSRHKVNLTRASFGRWRGGEQVVIGSP
jgi:hypothetical protein